MGFIWACPYGLAQSHPIWDQYGVYMGEPIWACPVLAHMGPILSCLLGTWLRREPHPVTLCLCPVIPWHPGKAKMLPLKMAFNGEAQFTCPLSCMCMKGMVHVWWQWKRVLYECIWFPSLMASIRSIISYQRGHQKIQQQREGCDWKQSNLMGCVSFIYDF